MICQMKYFFLLLQIFLAQNTFSAIYYVSTSGNDASDGSFNAPFKTIQKASIVVVPGDTIFVRAGTYTEKITPSKSGIQGGSIVYANYKDENVTIDGKDLHLNLGEGIVQIRDQNYIEFKGFHLINSDWAGFYLKNCQHIQINSSTSSFTQSSGIYVHDSKDIVLSGNKIKKACISNINSGSQECITISNVDGFEVKNNEVSESGSSTTGGEGINVKYGSFRGSIHNNEIHDLHRFGIYANSWDKYENNIQIYSNTIYNCKGGIGISAEAGGLIEDIMIYNNICYSNFNDGVKIFNLLTNGLRKNIFINHNTICNNGGGITIEDTSNIQRVFIINNICYQNSQWAISTSDTFHTIIENNLLFPFMNHPKTNEVKGKHSFTEDPLFINPAKNNYHLQNNSPAIDHAIASGVKFDFEDEKRPAGINSDIGAFEYPLDFNISGSITIPKEKNLIVNGDFENGNNAFFSQFSYNADSVRSGNFSVVKNAAMLNFYFKGIPDHTSGNGNYFIVDQDEEENKKFWCENVKVLPKTDYVLSVWSANIYKLERNPPQIKISINGEDLGKVKVLNGDGKWEELRWQWFSGNLKDSIRICMENVNTVLDGSDLGIDDIKFYKLKDDCPLKNDTLPALVHFPFNESMLTDYSKEKLKALITIFERCPAVNVKIVGYADMYGEDNYNNKLSEKRAKEILNYLIAQGVNEKRLRIEGKGENELIYRGSSIKENVKNRRALFIIE
jgi:outer membrane protein OmpA-like peptidoglycan-associated protein